jgi:hypothetical protein
MYAAEFFRQRPNFSVDLAEIICQKLATLDLEPDLDVFESRIRICSKIVRIRNTV